MGFKKGNQYGSTSSQAKELFKDIRRTFNDRSDLICEFIDDEIQKNPGKALIKYSFIFPKNIEFEGNLIPETVNITINGHRPSNKK